MTTVIDPLIAQGYAAALGEEPVVHQKLKPDYQIAIDRIQELFAPGHDLN